jgi:DNA recombination protein RmuC
MNPLTILITGLVGAALGALIAGLLLRQRAAAEVAALRERAQAREREASELRAALQGENARYAALASEHSSERERRATAEAAAIRVPGLEQQLVEAATEGNRLRTAVAESQTRLLAEQQAAQEKLALLEQAQIQLADAFKALSAEALQQNNQSFLDLAKTHLETVQTQAKGDLEAKQQAITELLKPMRESLEKVDGQIREIEKSREGAYQGLREQVAQLLTTEQQLKQETANLVQALRQPMARGRWGEVQLKRVVEMAGMLAHCDFTEQESATTEDGRLRPDLVVRLPGDKFVVVDAKAPLEAYLTAIDAPDEATRKAALLDHARQIRSHITSLGRKSYWEQFRPAPEFVVLFLPGENFFGAALEHDPGLIEVGVSEKVILATPTTLIALLKAVSYGWRQEHVAQDARVISDMGKQLYDRLVTMGDHMARLGKNLGSAVGAYNEAVGTLERRVLVSARKFRDLDSTGNDREIPELPALDHAPRVLTAAELSPGEEATPDEPTDDAVLAVRVE